MPPTALLLVVLAVAALHAPAASAALSQEPPATPCAAAIVSFSPCLAPSRWWRRPPCPLPRPPAPAARRSCAPFPPGTAKAAEGRDASATCSATRSSSASPSTPRASALSSPPAPPRKPPPPRPSRLRPSSPTSAESSSHCLRCILHLHRHLPHQNFLQLPFQNQRPRRWRSIRPQRRLCRMIGRDPMPCVPAGSSLWPWSWEQQS
ncbi:hypothetical protein VPH35_052139 [Triticum aestivum]